MLELGLLITLIMAIVAFSQANEARTTANELRARLNELASRSLERFNELTQKIKALEERVQTARHVELPRPVPTRSKEAAAPAGADARPASQPVIVVPPLPPETVKPREDGAEVDHPSMEVTPRDPMVASAASAAHPEVDARAFVADTFPPTLPSAPPPPAPTPTQRPAPKPLPKFNMEQFIGANLMAWAAGLAAFIGVILFVKYAFEKNLIPPSMRTAMGFLTGMGLAFAGLRLHGNQRFAVMSQALAATGVLVLYGVTFAAHSVYHFPMFNAGMTFFLMTLITTVAFLMAVRMDAQVVAVLGMLGGFLTPPLCSTGVDSPFGLFTYIALLDAGLLAVARHKRWFHLAPFAAAGTALMQLGWSLKFFHHEHYEVGMKTWIVVLVFSAFAWLFTAATRWITQTDPDDLKVAGSAIGLVFVGMLAAFGLMESDVVAMRPGVIYSLVMLVTGAVFWLVWLHRPLRWAQAVIGGLTFFHLAVWTTSQLTTELLTEGLALYLLFGVAHTAFAVVNLRKHGPSPAAAWTPVITLGLMMMPLLKLSLVPFIVWPALLLANLLVIGLALVTKEVLPVLAALLLTLISTVLFLFKLPTEAVSLLPFLGVLGFFAALFVGASFFLSKRLPAFSGGLPAEILPTASAVLPFGLLIMATLQLPVVNPAPVFGFGLALAVFLLVLARIATQPVLACAAALCVMALEGAWQSRHFDAAHPMLALPWHLGFLALFTVYPMLVHPKWTKDVTVWIGSVAASLGTFALVHWLVMKAWPNDFMGIVPALFVLPSLASLVWVLKRHDADNPVRLDQLAWIGGATLFFITLIFPIQFDKQWLTVAWALEGAALCWLFQRVPHRGLLSVASGLLTVAFVRLALNPEVLSYHERSGSIILNWFFYTYAIAAASCLGAAMLVKGDERVGEIHLRSVFYSFAGVLLFLLMNIEIADAFTLPGERFVTFQFSGNLARDMTYTIAWAVFAVSLLMVGFKVRSRFTRYAGIGLMSLALLKLFFHDLAGIDGIYRIGALLVVAVLGFAASYLYQRFADRDNL